MALIPPGFLDCVLAIGLLAADGSPQWVGAGFLYGELTPNPVTGEKVYRTYVVTNRHILEEMDTAYLRFNPEANEPAREFGIPLQNPDGSRIWVAHPDPSVDVAVLPINLGALAQEHIRFSYFLSDVHALDMNKAAELGLTEGDGVYVLGFPMGLVGGARNFVIVRQGSIARIRDALAGASKEFLVDATIFQGNSGGPVISKPEAMAIQGTKALTSAYLVGIMQSYVAFQDIAVSTLTKRPRIVFEENSGLAAVIPIDFVRETIREHLKKTERE